MSNDDYFAGALMGAFVALIASLMIFIAVREIGKAECEQNLPRTHQCELKWVKPVGDKK